MQCQSTILQIYIVSGEYIFFNINNLLFLENMRWNNSAYKNWEKTRKTISKRQKKNEENVSEDSVEELYNKNKNSKT